MAKPKSSTPGSAGNSPSPSWADLPWAVVHERPLGYGRLYREDFDNDRFRALPNAYKVIYFELVSFADNANSICWPSQTTLSKLTGFNRTTVIHGLQRLEWDGFIKRMGVGAAGTITWEIRHFKVNAAVLSLPGAA